MTVSAPPASAFTMSPEYLMPPSAISGTPWRRQTSAASMTAVSCGTPTPATMRVVQIEPGPTPQRTAETCALMSASAPSAVATLPPTISICGNAAWSSEIERSTASAWPCELSTRSTSAPARISASARSSASLVTPTAAPTRSRPSGSLLAFG